MSSVARVNPTTVHPPIATYSHVIRLAPSARRVVFAGQVGVRLDGSIVDDPEGQVVQVIANLNALLKSEGLASDNIVRMTVYLTDRALLPIWQKHRPALIGQNPPASTLIYVAGLADDRLKIEVELEAAA